MRKFLVFHIGARVGAAVAVALAILFGAMPQSSDAAGRGGVQRMAMRPGSYSIPARSHSESRNIGGGEGGSGIVPAYCLDHDLDPPGPDNQFTSIGGGTEVRIQLGSETMTLDEAIKRKLARVRGSSVSEYLESDAGKAELSRDPRIGLIGMLRPDAPIHKSLTIENLDPHGRPMKVIVGSPSLMGSGIGVSPHKLLSPQDITRALGQETSEEDAQSRLWATEWLRKAGYGKLGDTDAEFKASVARFQDDNAITHSGALDKMTRDAIDRVRRSERFLRDANAASGGLYRVMHVTRSVDPAKSAFYQLQVDGSRPKLVNSAEALAEEVNKLGEGASGPAVYLLLDGPSFTKDKKALQFSLQRRSLDFKTKVVLADEPAESLLSSSDTIELRELFLKVAERATVSEIDKPMPSARGVEQRFLIETKGGERLTLNVEASTPSLLARFFAKLKAIFSSPQAYRGLSYLALIQKARAQTAADLGITIAQVDREIRVNVREAQVADAGHSSTTGIHE
jgi:hypothetical protein